MEDMEYFWFIIFVAMVWYKTASEEQNKSNSKKQYKTESKEIDKQNKEKMEKIKNTIGIYLIVFGICAIISVIFMGILAGVDKYDKWKKQKILEAEYNRIHFEVGMDKREIVDLGKNGGYYEIRKDDFRGKSIEELTGKSYDYYIDIYRQYLKNDSEVACVMTALDFYRKYYAYLPNYYYELNDNSTYQEIKEVSQEYFSEHIYWFYYNFKKLSKNYNDNGNITIHIRKDDDDFAISLNGYCWTTICNKIDNIDQFFEMLTGEWFLNYTLDKLEINIDTFERDKYQIFIGGDFQYISAFYGKMLGGYLENEWGARSVICGDKEELYDRYMYWCNELKNKIKEYKNFS